MRRNHRLVHVVPTADQLEIRLRLASFGDAIRILRNRIPAQIERDARGALVARWNTKAAPVVVAHAPLRLRSGR